MKTKWWAILLVVLCTFVTTLGQFFLKRGVLGFPEEIGIDIIWFVLFNWNLIFGLFFYAVGAGMLMVALKYGELSVLYPFISVSFIWVSLVSVFYFMETLSVLNWLGIFCIIVGISSIGLGAASSGD